MDMSRHKLWTVAQNYAKHLQPGMTPFSVPSFAFCKISELRKESVKWTKNSVVSSPTLFVIKWENI